ncbi:MAG: CapA family protein [Myxococcota bacterium]
MRIDRWGRFGGDRGRFLGLGRLLQLVLSSLGLLNICCTEAAPELGDPELPPFFVTIQLSTEEGVPISGVVESAQERWEVGPDGRLSLWLTDATPFRASAEGFLSEPFVVGRKDDSPNPVKVLLLRSRNRIALHFGGDVMFGRRYETLDMPLIRSGSRASDAASVVSDLSLLFETADLSVVNLETVVSQQSLDEAYPRKRFLLQMHPESLAGISALGVDAVTLGNNHVRDWLDQGVIDTLLALEDAGIPQVGAGMSMEQAAQALRLSAAGQEVSLLSFTTVDGDFVNDNYPLDPTKDVDASERWQVEARRWGWSGTSNQIEVQERIVGEVWALFEDLERTLSEDEIRSLWESLILVYPELQDWVARRGHGGAAGWNGEAVERIALECAKGGIVVVQLHAGFQFQDAPSSGLRRIAQQSIEAGADLVVAHHPHVLQGMEWYRDKLIVYSLGNFVFDQNFLQTFPSGFLRVIFELDSEDAKKPLGERRRASLVQTRFYPLEIVGYRPVAVVDDAASEIARGMLASSVLFAEAFRDDDLSVKVAPIDSPPSTEPARFTSDRQSFLVSQGVSLSSEAVAVAGETSVFFEKHVQALSLDSVQGASMLAGRNLFPYGDFEDHYAEGDLRSFGHIALSGPDEVVTAADAPSGLRFLRMRRSVSNASNLLVRPVSRVSLPRHRLYDELGAPQDGVPLYEVRLWTRWSGRGQSEARLRLDYYRFDDSDPTSDPSSVLLGQTNVPLVSEFDGAWHQLRLAVPEPPVDQWGRPANSVLLYIELEPPGTWESILDVDQLEFWEFRPIVPRQQRPFTALHNPFSVDAQAVVGVLSLDR